MSETLPFKLIAVLPDGSIVDLPAIEAAQWIEGNATGPCVSVRRLLGDAREIVVGTEQWNCQPPRL
jgi:hypothetical protein